VATGLAARSADAQAPTSLTDSAFGALSLELSEPNGFFDTDNLVSNEDSYLHAVTTLQKLGIRGGAYLGVGPDQNFSYIAAIRPRIAFIIDIRRDNLLELLLYQSIFALSRNRVEYLALLFGKVPPADTVGWGAKSPADLLQYIEGAPPDSARVIGRVRTRAGKLGLPLSAKDLETIGRFHRVFIGQGPTLKLTTFNRPEREDYPDFRKLVLQTDLSGKKSSYLASEPGFQVVKSLEDRNLVVPVVGNFAGDKAVAAVAKYLKAHGEKVAMFYTSNVEEYLVRGGSIDKFAQNVVQLPRDTNSVIVRSYFPYGRPHPQYVQGYLSVQIVQRIDRFLVHRFLVNSPNRPYTSYYDLVTTDLVPPN
jgi:hypothetical protein